MTLFCRPSDLLRILCWDMKACPGAQWKEAGGGQCQWSNGPLSFSSVSVNGPSGLGVSGGKGSNGKGETYSGEKAMAVAGKGRVHLGGTAFGALTADSASLLSSRDSLPTHLFP